MSTEEQTMQPVKTTPSVAGLAGMEAYDLVETISTYLKYHFAKTEIENSIRQETGALDESERQMLKKLDDGFEEYSDAICNRYCNEAVKKGPWDPLGKLWKVTRLKTLLPICAILAALGTAATVFIELMLKGANHGNSLPDWVEIVVGVFLILLAALVVVVRILTFLVLKILDGNSERTTNLLIKIQANRAIKRDERFCRKHNINEQTLREAYDYDGQYQSIKTQMEQLRQEVYDYYRDELKEMGTMADYLKRWFPAAYTNADYLMYIRQQLNDYAADTWKEAVDLLQREIQHRQQMSMLQSISDDVAANRSEIKEMSRSMYKEIGKLRSEVDKRMSGLAAAMNSYHDQQMGAIYDTAWWY